MSCYCVLGVLCTRRGQHQREDPVLRRQPRSGATAPGRRERSRGDGHRAARPVQGRHRAARLQWKHGITMRRAAAVSLAQNARPRLLLRYGKGPFHLSYFTI